MGGGITFDIFTHVLHGSFFCKFINITPFFCLLHESSEKIHNDDLDDGYNVVSERETLIKKDRYDTELL